MSFLLSLFSSRPHTPSFGFNIVGVSGFLYSIGMPVDLMEEALQTRFRAEFSFGLILQPLVTVFFHREGSWEETEVLQERVCL